MLSELWPSWTSDAVETAMRRGLSTETLNRETLFIDDYGRIKILDFG